MTEHVFLLPDLGEGLTEAEIVEWRVAVGDTVEVDQTVVEVETAKAVVDVPCPYAGRVVALHGAPGEVRPVGQPLVTVAPLDGGVPEPAGHAVYREQERAGSGNVLIGYGTGHGHGGRRRRRVAAPPVAPAPPVVSGPPAGSAPVAADAPHGRDTAVAPARDVQPAHPATTTPRVISPLVRRLAREQGIDVAALRGTGPGGVVRRADVEAALRTPAVPAPGSAPAAGGDEVVIPLRGVRRAIADKLSRSRREIPEVTIWVDVDATRLLDTRAAINAARPDRPVSVLALLARICVNGLQRFPELNSRVDAERGEIVQSRRIQLGIAAQTDRGLVVPVISDAQRLTTWELAAELVETTAAARAGTLAPARLTGGTFTLNNYGVFGVDGSTPIINHPEAALLGIGRIVDKPWVVDGALAVRKVAQISLTFDHRVCDGGVAGGFLRHVADCIEQPALLIANV
ncbi:pyruvate dehydrogenase E2 component (dihydrolipoamide acetyltransferase) [Micromonospora pattaloongensis]|uniref:Dihydrolipoamide acetyltransferase component of pyruvate dehydrogenase complex n=1 Tax=Micromonospora pattaloongensis TaxID=405436 RepID=A0A1H3NN57_9ACTN|nr:dihydrolipoamide acetyltransferase family protein [Micromonospora pattaloongensis]SDY90228.1 pyruvate dehydrogenase E2 component (dihydrolipoamide acetyltransferase) [Micromonospora pattaloongensis]